MGFLWLSNHSQVDCGLRDHFATTVAHLWPSCITAVAFSFPFLPFRFLFPLPTECLNMSKRDGNIKLIPCC